MTRIILTRHGQTEWNRVERFRGRADIALNETGLIQAEFASKSIQSRWNPVTVYTSPMSRAVKTGEIIAAPHGLSVQPTQNLNDIDYGQWQGLTPDEVRSRWPELLKTWYQTPQLARIPGGELLEQLHTRAKDLIDLLVKKYSDQTIVLVGHDSINRVILLHTLGLPLARYWHLVQENCALNVIEADEGDFTVVSMNETCHLT
jgi:broad specificity phosphatase PhoE